MSDKPWDQLNPLDQLIRRGMSDLGMADNGTYLKIEYVYGFELFNTRPYHNYETWAGGYRITDERRGITVEREDLDDAVVAWAREVAEREPEMAERIHALTEEETDGKRS